MPLPPNFKLKAFELAFGSYIELEVGYIRWPLQIYMASRNGVSFKVKLIRKLREDNEAKHLAEIKEKSYQGAAFQEEVIDHEMAWAAARSGVSYRLAQQFGQKAKINVNATGKNKGLKGSK
jgi:hypothetical protein